MEVFQTTVGVFLDLGSEWWELLEVDFDLCGKTTMDS